MICGLSSVLINKGFRITKKYSGSSFCEKIFIEKGDSVVWTVYPQDFPELYRALQSFVAKGMIA